MVIVCSNCHERIAVSGELQEGQNVRCPYCNVKFAYHLPRATRKTWLGALIIVAMFGLLVVGWHGYKRLFVGEKVGSEVTKDTAIDEGRAECVKSGEVMGEDNSPAVGGLADGSKEESLRLLRAYLDREQSILNRTVASSTDELNGVLADQGRLSRALIQIEAENSKRAHVAATNGWKRYDKAEIVMMQLKDPTLNDLAIKYLGNDFSVLRSECRGKIKSILEMQKETSRRLDENRSRHQRRLEGIEDEVDTRISKAQEITLAANRDLEVRMRELEKNKGKKETALKRLQAIDRKSDWIVREMKSTEEEIHKLEKEISHAKEVIAVSRGNVAHIAATVAETAARRKGDSSLSARQDDDNAVHAEMAHIRTVFALATEYESRSLDKLNAAMRARKELLMVRLSDARQKLEYIHQSAVSADLLRPTEIDALRSQMATKLSGRVLDSMR